MGNEPSTPRNLASSSVDNSLASPASPNDSASDQPVSEKRSSGGKRNGAKSSKDGGRRSRGPKDEESNRRNGSRNSSSRRRGDDEESTAAILIDQMCVQGFSFFGSELKNGRKNRGTGSGSFGSDDPSYDDDRHGDSYDDDDDTYEDDGYDDDYRGGKRRGKKLDTVSESSSFVSNSMTEDYADSTASGQPGASRQRRGRNRDEEDSTTVEAESEEDSHRRDDRKAKAIAANGRGDAGGSSSVDGSSTALTSQTEEENAAAALAAPIANGSKLGPSGLMTKPLASSFAKRCYFTKAGIGKNTQHYEGLTLTGNVVLMLASAMKLKGCPTICDEDLRRVEQTYPNQFSRLPDELLLSSGWRRISKYCHFSNKPIPDGVPFFHSKKRIHPQTGGYFFLLAAAVGMIRPSDVEPLTMDTLIVLQTDFPNQCDSAPQELISDPQQWTLVDKFCFFSGGPINTEEDVYYRADFDGNPIYMLAFLSPALTPEELYRLNAEMEDMAGDGTTGGLKTVAAVQEVERVYDLTDRDFDDLKLYHLGPCRALPQYILQPAAWTKVLPPHFIEARQKALDRAQDYEVSNPPPPGQTMLPSPQRPHQEDLGTVGFDGFHFGTHPPQFPMPQDHTQSTADGAGWNMYGYNVEQAPVPAGGDGWQQQQFAPPQVRGPAETMMQQQQVTFSTMDPFASSPADSFPEEAHHVGNAHQSTPSSGVPMQQLQSVSPDQNRMTIEQNLQSVNESALTYASPAQIARPQSFDQSVINGQSAMEQQRIEQRLRGRSPGAAVFSFYDPNATQISSAPQQPHINQDDTDVTNDVPAMSASASPPAMTGEEDRQTADVAAEEVKNVTVSHPPVVTEAVLSVSAEEPVTEEQPPNFPIEDLDYDKEQSYSVDEVPEVENAVETGDETGREEPESNPVDVARQLKREVEEEGAFVTTLEEQPIDEAIATRAKLTESTSPEDADPKNDPPEEGEDDVGEQQGGIDPPDDEPPSLSPKSGSLPPTPTTTSLYDAPEDEVEVRESAASDEVGDVVDSPVSVHTQDSLHKEVFEEAEEASFPPEHTPTAPQRILEDDSPEKSHWSDDYDDKEDEDSDDMVIDEQLAPTITNDDGEDYDDENVPPIDLNNPTGKFHGGNDEVDDKLHDDDAVENLVENAIYEDFRQRRADEESTRGDGGDISFKGGESVYTREEEYYDDESTRRGDGENSFDERPEEDEHSARDEYENDIYSQPRTSPHGEFDDYSEARSYSSHGGRRSEPVSPQDDDSHSVYSFDRSESRQRALESRRFTTQESQPNSPSTVNDTDGQVMRDVDGSPTQTEATPTDVTPSSAMRGAQALLRKNRQKRLAMAAHRRQITANTQTQSETNTSNHVTRGVVSSRNLVSGMSARQPKTPTRRPALNSQKEDDQVSISHWDSETEGDNSMVSSPSSGWTENTGPADRSSRRALILQMAKARMKSTRAGITRNKRTVSSPASSSAAVRSNQTSPAAKSQDSVQSSMPKVTRIKTSEVVLEEDDEMQPPEQVGSAELDFTADLD